MTRDAIIIYQAQIHWHFSNDNYLNINRIWTQEDRDVNVQGWLWPFVLFWISQTNCIFDFLIFAVRGKKHHKVVSAIKVHECLGKDWNQLKFIWNDIRNTFQSSSQVNYVQKNWNSFLSRNGFFRLLLVRSLKVELTRSRFHSWSFLFILWSTWHKNKRNSLFK